MCRYHPTHSAIQQPSKVQWHAVVSGRWAVGTLARVPVCSEASDVPETSCSEDDAAIIKFLSTRTNVGTNLRKCGIVSPESSHISWISVTPVISTPWFLSPNKDLVAGTKLSSKSGALRKIRTAQSTAFFRTNELVDLSNFSTSPDKSRAISTETIDPSVHNARPATYWSW